ncbi:TetR/AcrR family transcriptional regulator [Demequina capsici]|uniref:TetR/AcrR family transcriptional regulator n=1 Tax=Demequina capsici TaxID=3075620 RepID=A0AA96FA91_9MICO|nr:TetR/AcrR family transcriptional regulator [Demequina sp. PMTSA13]WNM26439.1 TetR/AcrR family transcriptional regulator [Demequina sp. PMTSA13]
MPRIDAPTVAEHHALRRSALLEAGRTLLADDGPDAVTPKAVGAAAGIARSSVYQYFPSAAELMAAIVEDAFAQANAVLRDALYEADSPTGRLDAYLRTSLALATGHSHSIFDGVDLTTLPGHTLARIDELHREQMEPLLTAIRECGAREPGIAAQLVGGMLSAAARAVQLGADPADAERTLLEAVHHGPVPHPPAAD